MPEVREPVLSDEAWAAWRAGREALLSAVAAAWTDTDGADLWLRSCQDAEPSYWTLEEAQGLAALLLDTLGLVTREDVEWLRRISSRTLRGRISGAHAVAWIERVERYLPPPNERCADGA